MARSEGAGSEDVSRYAPLPEQQREGVALCLSGGGFRAALFHLGALRRLNELGILGKIDVVSSVSGGSIVAAALARYVNPWPQPGQRIQDFDKTLARPLREFTARNLRTRPILARALPWNWRRRAVEGLAKAYRRRLNGDNLKDLPARPKFIFCATDMAFGVNWVFDAGSFAPSRRRVGDYMAGYLQEFPDWPVAKAVAASSCFPPIFEPMLLKLEAGQVRRGGYKKDDWTDLIEDIGLSDGGVYDNMGLEPVWKRASTVLVSDGGAVFEAQKDAGLFWRLNRYTSITGKQGAAMRKRWLISSFEQGVMKGTYWGLGSVAGHYDEHHPDAYGAGLIDEVISEVRTDLDAFSVAEQSVLENHGYMLADAASRTHLNSEFIELNAPEARPPHDGWMQEEQIRQVMANSGQRKLLGHGFLHF